MTFLGDLGTSRDVSESDEFGWFGRKIRTNPNISELHLADFLDGAGALDLDDPQQSLAAMTHIKSFMRDLIVAEDFDAFWSTAKANGQGVADLMTVGQQVIESVVGRPTGRPSASTDGPSSTPTSSASDAVSIVASAHPGRPDLQVGALRAVG